MVITKYINRGFFLQIHLVQDLELADIGDCIGAYVLRMKLKKVQNISEEFRPGWAEAMEEVVSENNDFSILRSGSSLRHGNPPLNDVPSQ